MAEQKLLLLLLLLLLKYTPLDASNLWLGHKNPSVQEKPESEKEEGGSATYVEG